MPDIDDVIDEYANDDNDEESTLGNSIFRDILGLSIEEALNINEGEDE